MATKYFKLSGKPAGASIAVGIDVHKYKLVVFILCRYGREYKSLGEQAFPNSATGRLELCRYLQSFQLDDIVMEKTGKLSDSLYNALVNHDGWKTESPRISVVSPDTIKRFKGETHTDPNSAFQLARFALSGLINPVYITTIEGQRLRAITRESERYTAQSTAIINVMKDTLAGLGYTLPDFSLTNTWGLAFLRLLIGDGINGNVRKVYELLEAGHVNLHVSSKKALLDRKASYLQYTYLSISPFDARCLQRQLHALEMIEALKAENMRQIEDLVNETPSIKERVQSIDRIAGISTPGAVGIVAEADVIERFHSWKEFALYAGRAIAPDESGTYIGKPHMTKRCNHHLKRIFRQSGITATFLLKEDSDIKRYATRQLGKHSRTPAVACANTSAKIAKIVYKVLHDKVNYQPLHDTMKKLGKGETNDYASQDLVTTFRLKESRKRASRFRKFTRKTVVELPPGNMKNNLAKVLKILDEALDEGVKNDV
ncbi:MAG: transposase [Candidatus Lokiarchaeota archaeon]|nr:transposase [Candidatus Lokiarchaeota archaeon]